MAVTYHEIQKALKIEWSAGGGRPTATRAFVVDWADVFTFAKELYGRYRDADEGGVFVEPAKFPYKPMDFLGVTGIAIEPYETKDVVELENEHGMYLDLNKAKVTAKYGVLLRTPDADPEDVEEESVRISGQVMTLPEESFEWADDNSAISGVNPGKIMPTLELTITKYNVASLDDATILAEVGKVNDDTWRGHAAGKVLFMGSDARRSVTTEGAEDWEITYSFLLRSVEHNKFYKPDEGWEVIQDATTGDNVYDKATITDGIWVNLGM